MSGKPKIIFGVAYWLAQKFGMDPTIVRIGFIILTLFVGGGILLYLILWVLKIMSEE